jgi:hypothetical protein
VFYKFIQVVYLVIFLDSARCCYRYYDVDVLPGFRSHKTGIITFIKVLNDPSEANAMNGKPLAVISGNESKP